MYRLSDKEASDIIIEMGQPLAWITLSGPVDAPEITEALAKRAYACVGCRHPLLRAVYKPEKAKFSLIVRGVSEVIQDEADNKLPVHVTHEFHTRDEAWAEYKRLVEAEWWSCPFMWEVRICALDRTADGPSYVIFGHVNHGISDGAAVMAVMGQFVQVLNAGVTSGKLPSHDFLGPSLPVPKPFLERYPNYKYTDALSDAEKEELYTKVIQIVNKNKKIIHGIISDKELSEETSKKFISKCKANGFSVTAGLYAAVTIAANANKIESGMPLSFRTKEEFGDIAVSFTDAVISLDVSAIMDAKDRVGEENTWIALGKAFHKEIRKKLANPGEKNRGLANGFVCSMLNDIPPFSDTMCSGKENNVLEICMSNVGIVDKYFAECKVPWTVSEATAYCVNNISGGLVFWCYTLQGRLHLSVFCCSPPIKPEVFNTFTSKTFEIIEKN